MITAEYLAGYSAAVDELGREGDHRQVDWSEAYEFLRAQRDALSADHERPKSCRESARDRLLDALADAVGHILEGAPSATADFQVRQNLKAAQAAFVEHLA